MHCICTEEAGSPCISAILLPEKLREHVQAERAEYVFLTTHAAAAPFYHPPAQIRQAKCADVDDADGICCMGDLMQQDEAESST